MLTKENILQRLAERGLIYFKYVRTANKICYADIGENHKDMIEPGEVAISAAVCILRKVRHYTTIEMEGWSTTLNIGQEGDDPDEILKDIGIAAVDHWSVA